MPEFTREDQMRQAPGQTPSSLPGAPDGKDRVGQSQVPDAEARSAKICQELASVGKQTGSVHKLRVTIMALPPTNWEIWANHFISLHRIPLPVKEQRFFKYCVQIS